MLRWENKIRLIFRRTVAREVDILIIRVSFKRDGFLLSSSSFSEFLG